MSKRAQSVFRKFMIDLKDYKKINTIQSGSFGSVYLVQNNETSDYYAAKIINNTHKKETQYKQMINREIGIMIRCQHPTIISFIGYSLTDFNAEKNVTIIMELGKKGSLADYLEKVKSGLLDEIYDNTNRQIILVGIARGMMYLHQHQIIHRDLKPQNVLLDDQLRPHITDFGLSKISEAGDSSSQSQQVGTSIYMAPEVIEGARYNGKADVYSFGILMYEIVTDAHPYPQLQKGKLTTFKFNKKVVEEDYRPKFNIPVKKSIKKLIERCWSKNPKNRPSFEELFKKLAYNIEDSIEDIYNDDENDDEEEDNDDYNKYYLESVDAEEVISYADDIDNSTTNDVSNKLESLIDPLKKENEQMKKKLDKVIKENDLLKKKLEDVIDDKIGPLEIENAKLKKENDEIKSRLLKLEQQILKEEDDKEKKAETKTETKVKSPKKIEKPKISSPAKDVKKEGMKIADFNDQILQSQQTIVSEITSSKKKIFLAKVNDLLLYLLQIKALSSLKCIEINQIKADELLDENDSEHQINILSNATENLMEKKFLNSSDFNDIMNKFNDIIIEIKYPSDSFKQIYDAVLDLSKKYNGKIKIGIFITGVKNDLYFRNNKNISFVRFDSTVKEIIGNYDERSFGGCKSLKKVFIPSSVTKIGSYAFYECSSLAEISIPSSVIEIGISAFEYCSSLKQISIPSSITRINNAVFSGCRSLVKVEIPSSVTEILPSAFQNCSSLTQIDLPPHLKAINIWCFGGCKKLVKFTIPPSVTIIKAYAFNGCSSLKQILIPPSVTEIEDLVFIGCDSLSEIVIPSSVTRISDDTFPPKANIIKQK